jgi:ribonuclease HI
MDAMIHTDGAARGNPGPAACAFVIERPGQPPYEYGEKLGAATNNVAEYTALLMALEKASELGLRSVAVYSDSELMVKQFNGEYAVKNAELKGLHSEARSLARRFDSVTLAHIRRSENKRADQLCNAVLDGRPLDAPAASKPKTRSKKSSRNASVDAEAIACLRAALTAQNRPSAESLWEQICSVLEEGGVLKRGRGGS